MLPPPAPISIRSTAGDLIRSPLPFWKRRTRATSSSVVRVGWPPVISEILAVVPPMSKARRSGAPERSA
jgi:hypothetical protein